MEPRSMNKNIDQLIHSLNDLELNLKKYDELRKANLTHDNATTILGDALAFQYAITKGIATIMICLGRSIVQGKDLEHEQESQ